MVLKHHNGNVKSDTYSIATQINLFASMWMQIHNVIPTSTKTLTSYSARSPSRPICNVSCLKPQCLKPMSEVECLLYLYCCVSRVNAWCLPEAKIIMLTLK